MRYPIAHDSTEPVTILALGAGVQSTVILLMACDGEIEPPDHVVFANLRWEPPAVYRNLAWLKTKANGSGIHFHEIQTGDIREDSLRTHAARATDLRRRSASLPLFTLNLAGKRGQLRRQCTYQYKIMPINNFIRRDLLEIPKFRHAPIGAAEIWFGISTDEAKRAGHSKDRWKTHHYPLLNLDMSREDCHKWLDNNNYHHPARSSCLGCPYRSNAEWLWLKTNQPDAWDDACDFDARIRNPLHLDGLLFLHQQRVPLGQVKFGQDPEQETTPQRLTPCLGYCGT